jgi:TonB family protein
MDAATLYLIKSTLWLIAFAVVYHVFLRNERFFLLNRLFLNTGLISALLMPLWTLSRPAPVIETTGNQSMVLVDMPIAGAIISDASPIYINWVFLINLLFIAGVVTFTMRLFYQTIKVFLVVLQSGSVKQGKLKVIKTDLFPAPFSFFSYVFVSPSISDTETREIVNHEAEHIRQLHWIDLMLSELVCLMQWFNPVAWMYGHFIRQNHEYLADTMALKRTENPAIYRAVLINQLLGGEAIRLGHMFSYSLNKKRFTMMTNNSIKPLQKIKFLLVIPAIMLVIFACSKLDAQFGDTEKNDSTSLTIPPKEAGMILYIDNRIYDYHEKVINDLLKPESIQSVKVYKGDEALEKYGVLGKHGVIEITTKSGDFGNTIRDFMQGLTENQRRDLSPINHKTKDGSEIFMIVEQMPQFPGGQTGLQSYLQNSINYPEEAQAQGISGRVYVQFIINPKGEIEGTKILRGVHPLLDSEAFRVIETMPIWNPGMQRNRAVAVSYTVPINFVLSETNKNP